MPQHIGIAACSAEGAALCYRTICVEGAQLLGPHAHPEVSMHTHSLADYMRCLDRGDWEGVADLMLASADKLARSGADFLVCPDNTIHKALPQVEPRSPRPWLHIAEVVADRAVERGFRRLGLTGTRWLIDSEVYPEKLSARGLEYVRPTADERDEINRIIVDELVYGVFRPEAVATFQRVMKRMKGEGCDAVVLGCTEIPLVMNASNSPLPALDSTRLLAHAALRRAVQGPPAPGPRSPAQVRDVAPGLWIWRAAHPGWRPGCDWHPVVTSTCVESGGEVLLLDPLAPPDDATEVWQRLDARPPTVVVVLKPDHVRSVDRFVRRYGARAFGPRLFWRDDVPDAQLEPIEPGSRLPGGLVALRDGRGRDETPIWLPEQRAIVFADALTAPDGELRVWATPWHQERVLPALRLLLRHPFEHVIVCHGEPVHDRAAFERALELPPWTG
ncbi:MAG TPA: amino acid racemase [Kofleriaceae bacterium]|nr:amino acid racemase [Kofleriaceae bacterium]